MRFLIACILILVATSSWASDGPGKLQIVDGDTIYLGTEKIRLQGIDAPETEQMCLNISGRSFACGLDAKSALARRFEGRLWSCRASGTDRYRRTLATCFVDGEDVGQWLVREGWALAFRRYSNAYVADEDDARSAKRGLWSGAFLAPWDWRARSSQTVVLGAASVPVSASRLLTGTASEVSPSSGCTIKANLSSKPACIYHLPGGRFYGGLDMTEHAARRWFCIEAEAQAAGCRRSKL